MRHLFGTDGMRGEAGEAPLDPDTLYKLGRALVEHLTENGRPTKVCLGEDTRESCEWISHALARGVHDAGGTAVTAGTLPTPGLALITRRGDYGAGLMISASHNPFHDNGVKVFDYEGSKLPDEAEAAIERLIAAQPEPGDDRGRIAEVDAHDALQDEYLRFLDDCRGHSSFDGHKIVLDCAHGAASRLGPEAFRRAGATTIVLGNQPNGRNINEGCGSMHPELAAAAVRESGATLGFSFDGDADRCIACAPDGRTLDGDFLLYYIGRALHAAGQLPQATVVSTVMSNLGLEKALEREGITMLRAPVGDRYVLAEMRQGGFSLGGEQSGHVILKDYAPTGDGILTALTLTRMWTAGAGDLLEALDSIPVYPQVLRNVKVSSKPRIEDHPVLGPAVSRAEERMAGEGRVVVRYSGTEPKARVMIEGADAALVEQLVGELIDLFEQEIGL